MSNEKSEKERFIFGKGKELSAGMNIRGKTVGDRTIINIEALSREYKLAQAYANVRILEFRSKERIKIQSFKEYLDIRKDLIKIL